ncbi:hypothetical protein BS47DRAFT_1341993 [Hydnum rufescens UP504]|uniref:Queuosine 5'-phosphate N-glycosylase/hydrolase n=1 Tax=Hydnum rufescens UP504 TaxID=1448309 RepID=A0A9P6DYU5_9AGAM|nr:hypothetical protein BS47DRAFT_1341993 [Hydnum rufescens UP504]
MVPPESISSASDPRARPVLDWIFLVSALNFSFWSKYESPQKRYAVQWRENWDIDSQPKHWDGYWSLLAALNRALEDGIPITDPTFYASETHCPDSLIAYIFRASASSMEHIPLLAERIKIMREDFSGSFQSFVEHFVSRYEGKGTSLQIVQMVVETFPPFQDQFIFKGQQVCFWKRAQILIAETWAAFYPASNSEAHPILPGGIEELTMFADYRIPQILHQLNIITYDASLVDALTAHEYIESGSEREIGIRASSVLAVEALRVEIIGIQKKDTESRGDGVSSVLLDFFLWDLAKKIELGEEQLEISGVQELPAHRTRSIWY